MQKEKILIINDESTVVELISLYLNQKEYETFVALSGKAGIEEAIKSQPDLILLDVVMPEMDGFQVCEQLKENLQTKDIPVIFLSSLTDPKDKIKGLVVGGVDFITRAADRGELVARVQTHLKIRALTRELIERNKLLEEKQKDLDENLKAAAEIQRSLLPQQGLDKKKIEVAWKCIPYDLIGGDVFNQIPVDSNRTIFYMLDVSEHGVPSAMVTVSVSQHLHQLNNLPKNGHLQDIPSPKTVLRTLDEEFPLEKFNKFFSIFYMVINTAEKTACYGNAGHPPAILLHQNALHELLSITGPVIGANESFPFEERVLNYCPGDKLVLYTDGLTELQNMTGEFYGMIRLLNLLEKHKAQSVSELIETVYQALIDFKGSASQEDDISLMIIELK